MAASSMATAAKIVEQQHAELPPLNGVGNQVLHGADVGERDISIHAPDRILRRRSQGRGVRSSAAYCHEHRRPLRLAEQLVDLRVGICIEPDVPDITDDAYDLQRQLVRAEMGELFANWVLSGKSGAGQGLVDDGHIQRAAEVTLAEAAAFQQRDAASRGNSQEC